jgi:glycosyltransferase involved in cell wall biosynthesis
VIAGGAGDDELIEPTIAALDPSVRSRVKIIGRVSNEQKHWLLRHASVLAYPSVDEGFGFPLLEAMQYELPIVASKSGSIPEVAGDAALFVTHDDVDGFAEALTMVLDDSELRARLVAHGSVQVGRFSWEHTAAQLAGLYRRLQQEGC